MMTFAPTVPRRRRGENIVPMINVVFLLLIFFLMSAQIAPPDPIEVALPGSDSDRNADASDAFYISGAGSVAFAGLTGDAAWDALAEREQTSPLYLRADRNVNATTLAKMLPRFAAAGVTETFLVTEGR